MGDHDLELEFIMKNLKITISANGIHLKKTNESLTINHNIKEAITTFIFKYEPELIDGLNVNILELIQDMSEYDLNIDQIKFWKHELGVSPKDALSTEQVVISLFSDFDYVNRSIIMKRNKIKDTDEYSLYYNLD